MEADGPSFAGRQFRHGGSESPSTGQHLVGVEDQALSEFWDRREIPPAVERPLRRAEQDATRK